MDTILQKEVNASAGEICYLECLLRVHDFRNVNVRHTSGSSAVITFGDEAEYVIFVLQDILGKAKRESGYYLIEPDFDFMIRLEKKLNSFSKCDEFLIRKKIKDT